MTQTSIPKISVDLRNELPPVRDQGSRPLCLVFASSDLNSHVNNISLQLSVEYLAYYSYKDFANDDYSQGLTIPAVSQTLKKHGQPLEQLFPYISSAEKPKQPLDDYKEKVYSIGHEKKLSCNDIIKILEAGKALVVGVDITASFFNLKPPYVIDLENGSYGGHAIIIVGYGMLEDGSLTFLVRNSWGDAWGDNGHAWLTSDYLDKKAISYMELFN